MSPTGRRPTEPQQQPGRAYEAVTFEPNVWRAVVFGRLQKPEFNARGPAYLFARAVAEGKRKAEPVGTPKSVREADFSSLELRVAAWRGTQQPNRK